MTTPRHADDASPAEVSGPEALDVVVPVPADVPDRETLGRVLECLRDLPEQPVARAAPRSVSAPHPTAAVPLPRRRSARRVPSVD